MSVNDHISESADRVDLAEGGSAAAPAMDDDVVPPGSINARADGGDSKLFDRSSAESNRWAVERDGQLLEAVNARFDRIEKALGATSHAVQHNHEHAMVILRDRAVAAESGVTQSLLRPIGRQIAALIDRVELEAVRKQAEPWSLLMSVVDELLDVLADFGVETIECAPGEEVDRARHRVVETLSERNGEGRELHIVERVRQGYEVGGHVLRPAEVVGEWVQG
ncbi:nucleotide exchange factor GrpE [Gordonia sp. HNM0687]|uniref:Nucleotide exchange factor GrpE n=1 Tax=Gordonia mangrovi TaxID=2665643 RepID=A0A6L7GJL5_9ACTN|nr:nucleotide exchange factor GrpE [Gordonia mangrovi]MXP20150.1 nucleotide exchange factor GrpE [Gordonia mangrovi]UVF79242.1 nucleotide exchange factor GrpE [Gordonia mangrovi]